MNLNISRNVTRPVDTLRSIPRKMTYTVLLPAIVHFGVRMDMPGCMRVTGIINICGSNVASRRTTRTTYGTVRRLSGLMNVPRRLDRLNVARTSVPTLTRRTFASMYAPNGPHRISGRSVVTLCRGVLWCELGVRSCFGVLVTLGEADVGGISPFETVFLFVWSLG